MFGCSVDLFYLCRMKRILIYTLLYMLAAQTLLAQRACLSKLSPLLRHYVLQQRMESNDLRIRKMNVRSQNECVPEVMAFVKLLQKGEEIFLDEGCKVWAHWGNVYVATIPMNRVAKLSLRPEVCRIEANMSPKCTMDSAVIQVNALPVYEGLNLPQAFTGKGVVMGIMDIGFDLTHPNFYNPQMTEYRIKALWDQISSDTLQSNLPVGRDYVGAEALLALGCSSDGHDQTHGTHTLGIAAGSGGEGMPMSVPGKYHGVAYESDICLVANATTENQTLIDSSQLYKFTYAMDALGFKYIFDYADKMGQPCVISFSEGSGQDFDGTDILFHEVLDSMTSTPGHVIVSSAGNNGHLPYYMYKPKGKESAGCFVNSSRNYIYHVAKSSDAFTFRTTIYKGSQEPTSVDVTSHQVLASEDSTFVDTVDIADKRYVLMIGAYPSCYHPEELCYDWLVQSVGEVCAGTDNYISYQVVGSNAEVQVYHGVGNMYVSSVNPDLNDCELSHSINSPSGYESVICVGATINHTYSVDLQGNKRNVQDRPIGALAEYSSVGPTFDGRVKPDVVAPGSNVVASYSSFYEQYHPEAGDVQRSDVARFDYRGRTYAWNNNAGTSMASPVVGGAVALWLEANPRLSRREVLEIIKKTSRPLDTERSVPNNYWGYGEIDVYYGLLAALQVDGINGISTSQPQKASVRLDGNWLQIQLREPSEESFVVSVYNTEGVRLMSQKMAAGQVEYLLPTSQLPMGIYIVQMTGSSDLTGSSVVRKK